MANIATTFMGIQIQSPLVVASCGLTNTLEDIIEMEKNGAGAVILKSLYEEEIVTELEHQMHVMKSESHLYPETMNFYENLDNEDTLSAYLKLISDCKSKTTIPIIASINCVTPHNWIYFAKTLKNAGVDGIELNISLFPTDDDRDIHEIEQVYIDIIKAVKKVVDLPISIKIGPFFTNLASVVTRLSITGIRSITLFNKQYSTDINIHDLSLTGASKLSSPHDFTLPLRWCGILSNRINCEIATSTGIYDGETAIKMLLAGAQTVQVASTLYKNGIAHLAKMNDDIGNWMDQKGFSAIKDFRGKLALEGTIDPSAYYRIQFMKHYADKH